ncbi:hypothetical protein [Nocardia sp. NPDC052112]|uniref:hypothetical protein n=1 Tax=Nocardia sp. NPDC052112 TaxID=3155646 RepID=UPI003442B1F1
MSESAAISVRDSWIRLVGLWLLPPNRVMHRLGRFEVLLRIVVTLAVVAAMPVAGAIGTVTYTSESARIRAEQATKSVVSATITTLPERTPDNRLEATVQWNENGRVGTAIVRVSRRADLGGQVPVWLGPDGAPTSAPPRPGSAALAGLGASVVVLAGFWSSAWLLLRGGGWLLHR